ncbi:MAG TPA: hypothetical protein HPP83_09760 [Candidatus Hydrogenedentes bacterium]|nr:hypothetical protein [Candidatus Hydrogenedentota bacterium]
MAKFKLQGRERTVVICGLVAVALVVVLQLGRAPWREYKRSAVNVKMARERLAEVKTWAMEVAGERGEQEALIKRLQERSRRFDLYSFVSSILTDNGLLERGAALQTMNTFPSASNVAEVEMTLKGVSLEELVDVLHAIYDGDNLVALYKLDTLAPALDEKGLDCRMIFVSPRG